MKKSLLTEVICQWWRLWWYLMFRHENEHDRKSQLSSEWKWRFGWVGDILLLYASKVSRSSENFKFTQDNRGLIQNKTLRCDEAIVESFCGHKTFLLTDQLCYNFVTLICIVPKLHNIHSLDSLLCKKLLHRTRNL